jgi:uncharacterized protein (TIGR00266 family)
MQITTRHTPAFGVARIQLDPGEPIRIQGGAMMAMSGGMQIEARMEGGFMRSLKRAALGGESFFLTTVTAPEGGGWVDLAARLPGDLLSLEVTPSQGLVIARGAWLGSPPAVAVDTKWGGFKNLFGSEGGFVIHATGAGPVVVACYGAIETWDLAAGQSITIDTGHMVAYDDSVTMQLRKITGGVVQSAKSGEGLVFDFTGPGRVLTQTRNPNELLGWIAAAIQPSTS